jgi:signal transduction histidine kinase
MPSTFANGMQAERSDGREPFRVHRRRTTVDVQIGLAARGEGEGAATRAARGEEIEETSARIHAVRLLNQNGPVNACAAGARGGALLTWLLLGVGIVAFIAFLLYERERRRRLRERSLELEHLSFELARANRAKSEFLANVSHELRTPLAAIVGFVDLLRDGSYGELGPRMVGPVERIQASAEHLQALVDQILDLARLSAGRLEVHREPLSLRAFVIDVAAEVEPLIIEKGLALSIQVPSTLPRLSTDPTHLRQILVNLLGNAVKFTPSGSITLRAKLVPDPARVLDERAARQRPLLAAGGAWVALQVVDSGIGIAEKDQQRIFEEFEQVDPGSRSDSARRGTGLGLTITRRLARLLDGDITVESVVGSGSTFTCWLPVDPAPRAAP